MTVIEPNDQYFKQCLLERKQALLASQQAGTESTDIVELDQTRVGRLSRMDALQAQALSQDTQRRRQSELMDIAAALQRIATGDYGYCITCGEKIARKRLQVNPSAVQCIQCIQCAK